MRILPLDLLPESVNNYVHPGEEYATYVRYADDTVSVHGWFLQDFAELKTGQFSEREDVAHAETVYVG